MELFNQTAKTSYYLYDPRGSVAGLADTKGHLTKTYQYTVTGELAYGSATYENEYTYNGESYNPNIHSQYLRARYYSVVTASFLTEDSYLGNIREPLTLNRYNYCISSYLNYVDPSGNTVLWGLLERKIVEMEQRLVAPVIRNKINEAREAIQDAGDAVREAVAGAEEWVINKMAEMTVEFASQGETQANLVLIYLIVGENVYVCTESMKDAFLDRPSRLKIQAERMDLVQSYHIGRYGARLCQMAVGTGETVLGVWAMLSGMPTSSVPRYDPWNIPKGGWGSLAVPITNVFSARLAGAVGACYGAVSTGIALERALEEVVAMADIALGTVAITGSGGEGNRLSRNPSSPGGNNGSDLGNYKFKEGIDEDLRGGKGTFDEALEKAFEKTGTPKEDFTVTKWGKDKYGKSYPVEWKAPNGAEVSVDIGHSIQSGAPTADHVGWQTGGKRSNGGGVRGHIFVDEVPYNR